MNTRLALAVAIAAVTVAGCGAPASTLPETPPSAVSPAAAEEEVVESPEPVEEEPITEATTEPVATAEPTETATAAADTNERGNLVKKIGQRAGLLDEESGKQAVDFRVTKITPRFKCTAEYAQKPANGNFIAIEMDVQTTKDADTFFVDSGTWKVIGPDGTTENSSTGNANGCVPESKALPSTIGPGEHVKGLVILDSQYRSGAVALTQVTMDGGGWEWSFM